MTKGGIKLEIEFRSVLLRNKLIEPSVLKCHYPHLITQITNRMSELRAAKCLADIPGSPPPKLKRIPEQKNRWAISLDQKYALVFEAVSDDVAACDVSKEDVRRIAILDIKKL